jgi:hypothetical protein
LLQVERCSAPSRQCDGRNLANRMHATIGPTREDRATRGSRKHAENALQLALDGSLVRLNL